MTRLPAIPQACRARPARATALLIGPRHLVLVAARALEAHFRAADMAVIAAALGFAP